LSPVFEEQVSSKDKGYRYPAQIKYTGYDIQKGAAIYSPVFIRGKQFILNMDTKKVFFKIIKISNVYCVIIIIRKSLHIIKNNPVNNEDGKPEYKFAGDCR
jgi:hypothetical protein